MLFFGVEALRLVGCRKQIRVLLVILPMFIFTTAMVGYFGTRYVVFTVVGDKL